MSDEDSQSYENELEYREKREHASRNDGSGMIDEFAIVYNSQEEEMCEEKNKIAERNNTS